MPPYRRRNLAVNSRPPPDRSRRPFPRPPPAGLTGQRRADILRRRPLSPLPVRVTRQRLRLGS